MKFLCPSCKAKYQLADEKVRGRAVRMKCRQCGQMIRVSANDALEDSHSMAPEAELMDNAHESPPSSREGAWSDAAGAPPEPDDDETTAIVQPRAVARAMAAAKRAAAAEPEQPAADGWFVGINGVPVGPIRLSELRSKAATGAITPESLVWRDGHDEWRPLREFPALAELVDQVQAEALRAAERIAQARAQQPPAPPSAAASPAASPPAAAVAEKPAGFDPNRASAPELELGRATLPDFDVGRVSVTEMEPSRSSAAELDLGPSSASSEADRKSAPSAAPKPPRPGGTRAPVAASAPRPGAPPSTKSPAPPRARATPPPAGATKLPGTAAAESPAPPSTRVTAPPKPGAVEAKAPDAAAAAPAPPSTRQAPAPGPAAAGAKAPGGAGAESPAPPSTRAAAPPSTRLTAPPSTRATAPPKPASAVPRKPLTVAPGTAVTGAPAAAPASARSSPAAAPAPSGGARSSPEAAPPPPSSSRAGAGAVTIGGPASQAEPATRSAPSASAAASVPSSSRPGEAARGSSPVASQKPAEPAARNGAPTPAVAALSAFPFAAPANPTITTAPGSTAPSARPRVPDVATLSGADLFPAVTPSAAPAPVAPSSPFGAPRAVPPGSIADPFAAAATPSATATSLHVASDPLDVPLLEAGLARRSSTVKRVVLGAGLLGAGLAAGFLLFSPGRATEPAPAEPVSSGVAAAEPTEALPSIPPPEPAPAAPAPEQNETADARSRPRSGSGRPSQKTEPETPSKLTGDLRTLGAGPSPAVGPRADPVGGSAAPGTPELGAGQVQATVARYTSGVKRSCWQPALDTRDRDAPTSARVNVTIVVAPSGSVQDVSTSGDARGYPGLASCIATKVRGWQFPAGASTTTLNVPFVFAAQ